MTRLGHDVLRRAAPIHVASVRARLIDVISDEELAVLGAVFERLVQVVSDESHED